MLKSMPKIQRPSVQMKESTTKTVSCNNLYFFQQYSITRSNYETKST